MIAGAFLLSLLSSTFSNCARRMEASTRPAPASVWSDLSRWRRRYPRFNTLVVYSRPTNYKIRLWKVKRPRA